MHRTRREIRAINPTRPRSKRRAQRHTHGGNLQLTRLANPAVFSFSSDTVSHSLSRSPGLQGLITLIVWSETAENDRRRYPIEGRTNRGEDESRNRDGRNSEERRQESRLEGQGGIISRSILDRRPRTGGSVDRENALDD